jgi:hypothetical protein
VRIVARRAILAVNLKSGAQRTQVLLDADPARLRRRPFLALARRGLGRLGGRREDVIENDRLAQGRRRRLGEVAVLSSFTRRPFRSD